MCHCETCGLPLTGKHILVECPSVQDIHEKYFMVSSVKKRFDGVDNQSIIRFTETHFYSKLSCLSSQFYISFDSLDLMFIFIVVSVYMILSPTFWH